MSDQEPIAPQPANEERPQRTSQQANQPQQQSERGGHRGERDRGRRRHSPNQPQQQPQQQQQRRAAAEPSLNLDELRELVELIAKHGFTDFELEREGIRVRLRREVAPPAAAPSVASIAQPQTPLQAAPAAPSLGAEAHGASPSTLAQTIAEATKAAAPEEDLHIIPSPIVGTFYRSPSPDSDPFIRIGQHVSHDTVVCIIEAMKLMNEIQAETSGEIVKIYVENGQPVEYGQPLFGIKK
ncbi:MAG TPA: acetyl-CoA carboxylase biotin carboxyl carrier protein [Pyrinomonadaceae bacterium]|jgi:acetyl-CoA carboxylase biotin carboxyl carrier protein